MKKTTLGGTLILAAALAGAAAFLPAAAYHGTENDPAHAAAPDPATFTEEQKRAMGILLSAFPDTGALLSAQREVDGKIQQRRALSAAQQAALQDLFDAFPDAETLAGARAAVAGEIEEKRGEVIAELHGMELPEFGGAAGEKARVVEFSDYQCGFCKRMFGVLRGENARVKVVEFPILGPLSRTAAEYALAARKQNKYEEFHIALMSRPGRLSEEALAETATNIGLDVEKLKTDSKSEEVSKQLEENFRLARLLGVRGTPFMVVGNQSSPGAVSQERLREMLAAAGGGKPESAAAEGGAATN